MKEVPANFLSKNKDGIEDSDMANLFTKFHKGNHKERGSGFGLYYAKTIMEMHGGLISPLTFKPIWGCAKIGKCAGSISAFEKNISFLSSFYLHIKILCVSLYKRRKDERH